MYPFVHNNIWYLSFFSSTDHLFEPVHPKLPRRSFPERHYADIFHYTAAVPASSAIPSLASSVNSHLCQVNILDPASVKTNPELDHI